MSQQYRPTLAEELARWSYSLLLVSIVPVMLLHWLVRLLMGDKTYSFKHRQRFAILPKTLNQRGLLVHCVSVGEVTAAAPLIRAIQQQQPDLAIVISTTTATGAAHVKRLFADDIQHIYLPYDLPWMMGHLLKRLNPRQVLITEVELWPNLIHQCWKTDLPVAVINARMTDSSRRSYLKLRLLFRPMLEKISRVCAQGQRDFTNYQSLGIRREKLTLTGNLKFDLTPPDIETEKPDLLAQINPEGSPILLAASTHEPEEALLLEAFSRLKAHFTQLKLVVVPRHPQRFDAVAKLCQQSSHHFGRSSQGVGGDADIVLVDQMGLLSKLYGVADIAFVGGSIAPRGGHNPLEAAVFGVPVIMGSSRYNNGEICAELAEHGGLVEVANVDDISERVSRWLTDSQARIDGGKSAREVVDNNRGAIAKTLEELFPQT